MGATLLAEGGEALGGVGGREQTGHRLAFELDRIGEREGRAAVHELLGGQVRERRTGRDLPREPFGDA